MPGRSLSRRLRRAGAAALALVAVAAALAGYSQSRAPISLPGRPNIVFVLTDDLATNLVRYMPHVRALQREGESFSNYFVVDSLCCPSRTAIFTGLYPHDDGVFTNSGSDGGYPAFNEHGNQSKTFAVALQRSGYRTALMGKYLNEYTSPDPVAPGWNDWQVSGRGYAEFDYTLNDNGTVDKYGQRPDDYLTDVLSAKAGGFITDAARADQPFLLEVATFAPHSPFTPAPRDADKFPGVRAPRTPAWNTTPTDAPGWLASRGPLTRRDVRRIDREFRLRVQAVQSVDRMIGHLEQVLATTGQASNTYFVFSSDNGYHMGEYRLNPGKQTAFDTDIKVPLVVTGPGVPAGVRNDTMTSSIDLAPTFEQIGAAKQPDQPDGASLLGLWHGQQAPPSWQQAVLIEHHGPGRAGDDPDRQTADEGTPPSYEAVRTPTALYVEYDNSAQREYYRLTTDPDELHNLVRTTPASVLGPLRDTLHALESCHGATQCQAASQVR